MFFWVVAIGDFLAGLAIGYILISNYKGHYLSVFLRIGLAVGAAGLLADSLNSFYLVLSGEPYGSAFHLWILKDWGYTIIACAYLHMLLKQKWK